MGLKSRAYAMVLAVVAMLLISAYAHAGGPKVEGSGTPGTIPQWTAPTTLGDSVIVQSSNNIGIGTSTPTAPLDVNGPINTAVQYDIGGLRTLFADNFANTATGWQALANNSPAFELGTSNTATGTGALQFNTTGSQNTAVGAAVLFNNTTGNFNTATGFEALAKNTGNSNIALGYLAGFLLTTGDNNIAIGNFGVPGESGAIRIGTEGTETSTYIAGISVATTGLPASTVAVDASGHLGTISSSRRAKDEIREMGAASAGLWRLRPVTFRYKSALTDGSRPLQYGLIAEEVAEVYPELVAYDRTGQPQTVLYHVLPALLLNEVQNQHRQIEAQQATIREQATRIVELEKRDTRVTELEQQVRQLRAEAARVSEILERLARIEAAAGR